MSDRTQIEWTPDVVDLRARRVAAAELEMTFRTATPNLDGFLVQTGEDRVCKVPAGRPVRWVLKEGHNTFRVRTLNLAGEKGPWCEASLQWQP